MINPIKNSDDTFAAINVIAGVSGNEKQRQIEIACKYPKFISVCKLALDPFITYGVKKTTTPDETGENVFGDDTLSLLDELASRNLTGNAAQDAITQHMSTLTKSSQTLLDRVIKKDLKAAFSAKAINKAKPGTIFVFECMLAKPYEEKRIKSWPVAVEPKYDGVRCLVIYQNESVKFYSRTGKEFTQFDEIAASIKSAVEACDKLPNHVNDKGKIPLLFDGEMMTGQFNKTAGDIHRKDHQADDAVFHIFELMPLVMFNEGDTTGYMNRRAVLEVFFKLVGNLHSNISLSPAWMLHSHDEVMEKHMGILAEGGEGVIVKPLKGRYEKKRSFNWLKLKDCNSVDLVIEAYEEGKEGSKLEGKLGAFVVDFAGVKVSVGSGLNDEIRDSTDLNGDEHIGRMIEVQYHEKTPDGSLRHPRFVRFRDDKPHEDGPGHH